MGRCLLGLYVGTKNVVGTLYDPAGYELLVVRPMLNKEFMLMHYLELAGDEAYRDSQPARESSIPGAITIDGIENTAVLTYHLSGVGCLGKAFPAGPPPAGPPPES
ncbi:hypothetical protein Q3G72_004145 [Acer saccharum]|nr:hypothetical protein Q3G72_004145 [Acer saccharum]